MISNNVGQCPECGAPAIEGMTCYEQLGLLIAWEHNDAELQAEHFLIVASYNLQHPAQFTSEALAGLQAAFVEYLDDGLTIVEIRRRIGKASEGGTRVLRDQAEQYPTLRSWSMTIADVYIPDQPQGAAGRVRSWAAGIRREL